MERNRGPEYHREERSARARVRRADETLASAGMERSRHGIPNDSIGISGLRRAWAATSTLSKARSGWRTSAAVRNEDALEAGGAFLRKYKVHRVRALTPQFTCGRQLSENLLIKDANRQRTVGWVFARQVQRFVSPRATRSVL